MRTAPLLGLTLLCVTLRADDAAALQTIMERLDNLQQQNRLLVDEVHSLRQRVDILEGKESTDSEIAAEKLEVQESRTQELAQSKVEASQKLPLTLTGMVLFNAFLNGRHNAELDHPALASLTPTPASSGATLRQTILGLRFHSPRTIFGAEVNGSADFDFYGGAQTGAYGSYGQGAYQENAPDLGQLLRMRTAVVELAWSHSSLIVGQDKPLISPRDPTSLAYVATPPLSGAGNPWYWQPQARFEQRFDFSDRTRLRAQAALMQTEETTTAVPGAFSETLEERRPAWEGRLGIEHSLLGGGRIEVASGVHASATYVALTSVPSRLYTLDWFLQPATRLRFEGLLFTGQNTANLGMLGPGFTVIGLGQAQPVHNHGGWGQVSFNATSRLTFNLYGGEQANRQNLPSGEAARNFVYAGNAMFRIAPNVDLSFEANQARTRYLGLGSRVNNHYDLALGYSF